MEAPPSRPTYRFGDFEFDPASGELTRTGRRSAEEQPFQILTLLLKQPGEVVTREQVRQALWPGDTFVDFDVGLNSAIKRLRDALNDSARNPRFVETLPPRGYRFVARSRRRPVPLRRRSRRRPAPLPLRSQGEARARPAGVRPPLLGRGGAVAALVLMATAGRDRQMARTSASARVPRRSGHWPCCPSTTSPEIRIRTTSPTA